MAYLLLAVGFGLLFGGGEALVRGGIGVSRVLGLSPLLIGLVIVSAATSAPELVVVLRAVTDHPDIATGAIIGSNIANILLILGLAALIRSIPTSPKLVFRDGATMLIASVAFVILAWDAIITGYEGWLLLLGLILFMILSFAFEWRRPHSMIASRAMSRINGELPFTLSLFYVAIGVALLYFGASFLLDGGLAVARDLGWDDSLTGLTLVAIGTSFPELVVTLRAINKNRADLAVGNLIGSNVFNILGVLGITAAMRPVTVSPMLAHQDALVMTVAAAALLPLLVPQWRLSRRAGLGLLLGYGAYLLILALRQSFG